MNDSINLLDRALEKVESGLRQTQIKQAVEALLFAASEPISLEKIREVISSFFPVRTNEIEKIIEQLAQEYKKDNRAFQIDLIAGGYQLRTLPEVRPYIERLQFDKRGEKLSTAASEVLAIVAFRSPITRREIENLRGVDSSCIISGLMERGLVEAVGRKESPGRPMQYGVTKQFLTYFGLNSLQELQSI